MQQFVYFEMIFNNFDSSQNSTVPVIIHLKFLLVQFLKLLKSFKNLGFSATNTTIDKLYNAVHKKVVKKYKLATPF